MQQIASPLFTHRYRTSVHIVLPNLRRVVFIHFFRPLFPSTCSATRLKRGGETQPRGTCSARHIFYKFFLKFLLNNCYSLEKLHDSFSLKNRRLRSIRSNFLEKLRFSSLRTIFAFFYSNLISKFLRKKLIARYYKFC